MIKILKMKFSNMFSYGGDVNEIDFTKSIVTQLVGANGAGKSSIPLILEELLRNKNSKGIKKGGICRRGEANYSGEVHFSIGEDLYILTKKVGKTATVKLTKNGLDVSGHTATQTYQMIEDIMGLDFNTYSKLVYQSMKSSLDFLEATDATRKKFLVSLLGLESYTEAEIRAKSAVKDKKAELSRISGAINLLKTNKARLSNIGEVKPLLGVPDYSDLLYTLKAEEVNLAAQSVNIESTNKAIRSNKALIKKREELKKLILPEVPEVGNIEELIKLNSQLTAASIAKDTEVKQLERQVASIKAIKEHCITCKQKLPVGNKAEQLEEAEELLYHAKILQEELRVEKVESDKELAAAKADIKHNSDVRAAAEAYYAIGVDVTLPVDEVEATQLKTDLERTKSRIKALEKEVKDLTDRNIEITKANELIKYKTDELANIEEQLLEYEEDEEIHKWELAKLETLVAAFGSKGLISYKIESTIKVFEELINEYLQILSDGEFALTFSVEETKLSINLYADGELVDFSSLSSGEFNKVNTATLLAVRKMMTAIAKVDINLLFIDEVVSVLDQESKDTLISALLKEQKLNSIVVSHGYTHPLADIIEVNKKNKVSRIVV